MYAHTYIADIRVRPNYGQRHEPAAACLHQEKLLKRAAGLARSLLREEQVPLRPLLDTRLYLTGGLST